MNKVIYLLVVILAFGACHKENKQENQPRDWTCYDSPNEEAVILIDKTLVPEGSLQKFVLYEENEAKEKIEQKQFTDYQIVKDTIHFTFAILHDMDRVLGKRTINFSLEIPNFEPISMTFSGEYITVPRCCSIPKVYKAWLNGKEWNPKSGHTYILPKEVLKKKNLNSQ
ncbi:hypothetical protein [Capnocytophaga gingivalis]|uniref:hypothetical protein n=1 Tax=Capnocytophaga gingivalis TaxID=1017 RepID=UPI00288BD3B5|nr:hypothetical protein [Capnocytophaga gingivalis]